MTIAEAVASAAITDSEAVRRVVDGDTAFFEILMRRHNQRIYRAVRAVLGSEDEVEDVMQQAYLNAYQHLRQFAGGAQFSTWLTRIAINEALARRRKRAGFVQQGDDEMTLTLVDEKTPDPERQASAAELREVMEREVAALPETFRTVFVLRDVEGLSTAETAQVLGISEELAKQRLHRARTQLRENLYRRAGITLASIFTFGNERCDRVVASVMGQLT
jgi:RNA polymerase sigma-70 factor, ECF subfamily